MDQGKAKKELLSESAVETVVGGQNPPVGSTLLFCYNPTCKTSVVWVGNFLGKFFDCPRCSGESLPPEQRRFGTLLGVEYNAP